MIMAQMEILKGNHHRIKYLKIDPFSFQRSRHQTGLSSTHTHTHKHTVTGLWGCSWITITSLSCLEILSFFLKPALSTSVWLHSQAVVSLYYHTYLIFLNQVTQLWIHTLTVYILEGDYLDFLPQRLTTETKCGLIRWQKLVQQIYCFLYLF